MAAGLLAASPRHPFRRVARLRQIPVAIVAAGQDEVVPPARTEALRRALPRLVFDATLAGARHNTIFVDPAFHRRDAGGDGGDRRRR